MTVADVRFLPILVLAIVALYATQSIITMMTAEMKLKRYIGLRARNCAESAF